MPQHRQAVLSVSHIPAGIICVNTVLHACRIQKVDALGIEPKTASKTSFEDAKQARYHCAIRPADDFVFVHRRGGITTLQQVFVTMSTCLTSWQGEDISPAVTN